MFVLPSTFYNHFRLQFREKNVDIHIFWPVTMTDKTPSYFYSYLNDHKINKFVLNYDYWFRWTENWDVRISVEYMIFFFEINKKGGFLVLMNDIDKLLFCLLVWWVKDAIFPGNCTYLKDRLFCRPTVLVRFFHWCVYPFLIQKNLLFLFIMLLLNACS